MTNRHLLIAGQGRSGSTLLYNMMRATLQGFEMPEDEAPALSVIRRPESFCTKRPFDIFDVAKILAAAGTRKRVDLIVPLRDPRDLLTSRHRAVPHDYFYGAQHCYFIPPDGSPPTLTAPGILPVHDAIAQVIRANLFPQGVQFVRYEELVAAPESIRARLEEAFFLDFKGRFSDFHRAATSASLADAMNGVRPVDASGHGKWRAPEHRQRLIEEFTRTPRLHDMVIALGYAPDRGWFDDLLAQEGHATGGTEMRRDIDA